jgi:hypothetical protein
MTKPTPSSPTDTAPCGNATPEKDQTRPPPGAAEARHKARQRADQQAEALREIFIPECMASALGMGAETDGKLDNLTYRAYLDQFLRDSGNPRDAVERALVEQIAFVNLRLGQLHLQSANSKSTEAAKVYHSATARLLGEFRRMTLTLQEYRQRTPVAQRARVAKVG